GRGRDVGVTDDGWRTAVGVGNHAGANLGAGRLAAGGGRVGGGPGGAGDRGAGSAAGRGGLAVVRFGDRCEARRAARDGRAVLGMGDRGLATRAGGPGGVILVADAGVGGGVGAVGDRDVVLTHLARVGIGTAQFNDVRSVD